MCSNPSVTLIILTWNSYPFLRPCLETALHQDYPDFSVMVLDNGSTDGTLELVRKGFPAVGVVENRFNLGFAAGNNVGLRLSSTPFVVLLNPDVELAPNWLSRLIEPMVADSSIGVAGCKVFEPGNTILQHAGGYITFPQALPGHYGLHEADHGQHDQIRDVDYVMGAAMAIRGEVMTSIGLLDEGFFLYYDDVDYCHRVRSAGYRVVYIPEAELMHMESTTTNKGSVFYFSHMHASRWRYMLKYYAVDDLLESTIPAEKAWLADRGHAERLGLQFAYVNAQRQLPFLWQQRLQCTPNISQDAFHVLNTAITSLRNDVWLNKYK